MRDEETTATEELAAKRKVKRRSLSPEVSSRRKESSRDPEDGERPASKRKKERNGEDRSRSKKKKKKKSKSKKRKKKKSARSDDSETNSEPEEGEITESDREEWDSSSASSSHMETPESEMEVQCPEGETTRGEPQSGSGLMSPKILVGVELFPTTFFIFCFRLCCHCSASDKVSFSS